MLITFTIIMTNFTFSDKCLRSSVYQNQSWRTYQGPQNVELSWFITRNQVLVLV